MPRIDAYPEALVYADTGCRESPRCLDCPLPVCRFDDPAGRMRALREERARRAAEMRRHGASIDTIATAFGLSRRSVQRVLATGGR